MTRLTVLATVFSVLLLTACGSGLDDSTATPPTDRRTVVPVNAEPRGQALFRRHCAECHGDNAQGAANWSVRGADGKFPPPPLNGTAHAWHHPRAALKRTIRDGTAKIGGNMPAFGGELADDEIDSIIDWFSSLWPAELYQAWTRNDGH